MTTPHVYKKHRFQVIFGRFYMIASNCFLYHCVLFSFRKHLQKQWVVCGFYMPFKHLFVCLKSWNMLIPGLQLIHPKNVRSSPRIDAIERSNSRCRSWGLVLDSLGVSRTSRVPSVKIAYKFKWFMKKRIKKMMLASLTKTSSRIFLVKKTLEMCLNLKWKEMFTTVYDWYFHWPHRQNNGSIPSCSCCIRSKNAEGSSPLKQPRSSSSQESSQISWWFRGWHCRSWQVDHTWKSEMKPLNMFQDWEKIHHLSFHLIWGFGKKQFQYVC